MDHRCYNAPAEYAKQTAFNSKLTTAGKTRCILRCISPSKVDTPTAPLSPSHMSDFSTFPEMEFPNPHPNASISASDLLLQAALMIPVSSYLLAILGLCLVFFYNFFEMHFIEHLVRGFRGDRVSLTYDPCSEIFHSVVNKCRILRGRWVFKIPFSSSFYAGFF